MLAAAATALPKSSSEILYKCSSAGDGVDGGWSRDRRRRVVAAAGGHHSSRDGRDGAGTVWGRGTRRRRRSGWWYGFHDDASTAAATTTTGSDGGRWVRSSWRFCGSSSTSEEATAEEIINERQTHQSRWPRSQNPNASFLCSEDLSADTRAGTQIRWRNHRVVAAASRTSDHHSHRDRNGSGIGSFHLR